LNVAKLLARRNERATPMQQFCDVRQRGGSGRSPFYGRGWTDPIPGEVTVQPLLTRPLPVGVSFVRHESTGFDRMVVMRVPGCVGSIKAGCLAAACAAMMLRAVNVGMLDGHLAWRQHDGGHTDGPNWEYFIPSADRLLGHKPGAIGSAAPGAPAAAGSTGPADRAAPRTDQNSMTAHAQLLEKARAGGIDVYFIGDSITRRWGATDYPDLLANWRQNFFGWNAGNFGWGADRTQNILWRLEHGELDGVNPKVIVIQAGTNNIGAQPGGAAKVAEITRGLTAILDLCRQKAPRATVILTAIFPRNDNMAVMPEIDQVNANLARLADGRNVRYLSVNERLAGKDGRLFAGMMNERDKLHPTLRGYQVWADGLKPILTDLLGPPAPTDHAPPPTGDPSARPR
jgi:lysophospholipase L1-like esterase